MNKRTLKVGDIFSKEEIQHLTRRSDWHGLWTVGFTWGSIAACFALLAQFPNPLTYLLVVVLLGGRQLALAILMHEGAHRTLFKTPWLNDGVTDWLCARPVWNDLFRYRTHHLKHHTETGTESDPDISLIEHFPTTPAKLRKKLLRDITGASGLRRVVGLVMMDIGLLKYTVAADVQRLPQDGISHWDRIQLGFKNMGPMLLTNALLFAVLHAFGDGWMFTAWVLAYLTTFSLYVRIRAIAEHAGTERNTNPLENTRTTHANWLARITIAPIHVNYHLEHHLMAAVPHQHLRTMHQMLKARAELTTEPGYLAVYRKVTTAA